jgi:hypothetical protein
MPKAAFQRLCIFCLTLLISLVSAPAQAAPAHNVDTNQVEYKMVIHFRVPPVEIYEGDIILLPYTVTDLNAYNGITLAPLTPGTASISAQLGSATVKPRGISGLITYKASKAGQERLNLTISNYFGKASAALEFEVLPRPNYELDIIIISEDKSETGGAFRGVFTGQGSFANLPDQPIQGAGSADYWFALWVSNDVMSCAMQPPMKATSTFQINGTSGLSPLSSSLERSFMLDLDFQPAYLQSTKINCSALGGFEMTFDMPGAEADANEFNLRNLNFPGEGGVVQVTGYKTWGMVIATRME